jgi:hypothetical protein
MIGRKIAFCGAVLLAGTSLAGCGEVSPTVPLGSPEATAAVDLFDSPYDDRKPVGHLNEGQAVKVICYIDTGNPETSAARVTAGTTAGIAFITKMGLAGMPATPNFNPPIRPRDARACKEDEDFPPEG